MLRLGPAIPKGSDVKDSLSVLFSWSINEGILETSSLVKIKVPRAEKKVVKSLIPIEVNQLISSFKDTFEGIRNKAIILILVDCGLRLGELLSIKLIDVNTEQQLLKVDGKTGEFISSWVKVQSTYC